jgi:gamma-glutamylcyclotransferase (GGCT)/AIG2-like uncharacterized protein YtfP
MKQYIFVYGLFRDSGRGLLNDATFCGRATVNGKIYRVSEFYPGFVNAKGKVFGDVYLIDPSILPKLDEFEGDEYFRTKIHTSIDIECWIYQYKNPIDNFKEIKGGDWILR